MSNEYPIDYVHSVKPFYTESFKAYEKFYYPHTNWKMLPNKLYSLPKKYWVDVAALRGDLLPFLVHAETTKKGQLSNHYTGVGFTKRASSPDEHSDAIVTFNEKNQYVSTGRMLSEKTSTINLQEKRHSFERDFDTLSKHCPASLENYLKNFKSDITKVRLLKLDPQFGLKAHIDLPYYEQIRLQIVLETNPQVIWYCEDKSFTLPADGKPIIYDVGRSHSILNFGTTARVVLCIHLSLYKFRDGRIRFSEENELEHLIQEEQL